MTLPAAVRNHHTVWVSAAGARARPVRYVVEGDRLVCFGDDGLSDIADGARVTALVREIACGPPLASFDATLRVMPPGAVDQNTLIDILGHVALGPTLETVATNLQRQRAERRIVELAP
jgi:hypothetical protein